MKRIVVGTDLSDRSSGAVEYAAQLAEVQGATLHLVNVTQTPLSTAEVTAVVPSPMTVAADAVKEAARQLAHQADRLRDRGLAVEVHACEGSPSDLLCSVADTVDADLIVVGNRRMKGAGRVLGSVPNRVAHRANCSVLIARTGD